MRRDLLPSYVVFHDTTLREMARLRPTSINALLAVKGVGARPFFLDEAAKSSDIARPDPSGTPEPTINPPAEWI